MFWCLFVFKIVLKTVFFCFFYFCEPCFDVICINCDELFLMIFLILIDIDYCVFILNHSNKLFIFKK